MSCSGESADILISNRQIIISQGSKGTSISSRNILPHVFTLLHWYKLRHRIELLYIFNPIKGTAQVLIRFSVAHSLNMRWKRSWPYSLIKESTIFARELKCEYRFAVHEKKCNFLPRPSAIWWTHLQCANICNTYACSVCRQLWDPSHFSHPSVQKNKSQAPASSSSGRILVNKPYLVIFSFFFDKCTPRVQEIFRFLMYAWAISLFYSLYTHKHHEIAWNF